MDTITVNGQHVYDLTETAPPLDALEWQPGNFHILKDGVSYAAEVLSADYAAKTFVFRINGRSYAVKAENDFDRLLQQMGMDNAAARQPKELKAPMPGLLLAIKVTEGQAVQKGDPLAILEAMKMENIIKSPADGVVKAIKARQGDTVDKNQVLLVFA